jgi:hypothetical protein
VPAHRLFIIAPSLVRLIQKERGGERVWEGYIPDQLHRGAFVQIGESSSLIRQVTAVASMRPMSVNVTTPP